MWSLYVGCKSHEPEYLVPDGMKLPNKAMHSGFSIDSYIDSETDRRTEAGLLFYVRRKENNMKKNNSQKSNHRSHSAGRRMRSPAPGLAKISCRKERRVTKTVTVKVVHGDGSEKEFSYATDEAYLGAVIQAENLVEGEEGQYGLFMTSVDGEKADDSKQQWWCLTKGGEQVNTSADQTPIEDGDTFELTLTEGY